MKFIKTVLLIIIVLVTRSFAQNSKTLQQAYKEKSTIKLNQFFKNWSEEIPPINLKEYSTLNDTIKQAYDVFSAFYQPLNIKGLGGSEWGNDIYKNVNYLIVQNSIKIYFTNKVHYNEEEIDSVIINSINSSNLKDSVKRKLLQKTNDKFSPNIIERFGPQNLTHRENTLLSKIENFRPLISGSEKRIIYLTAAYDTLLNAFLGNTHIPIGGGGIMNPARSSGESDKRQNFLQNSIKIWYGHWGGYWQLYSYPTADRILFDKNMQYAIVYFRLVYEGGEAMLKNNNGKWEIISSKRTWIE